jgi:hypothetical protein
MVFIVQAGVGGEAGLGHHLDVLCLACRTSGQTVMGRVVGYRSILLDGFK